MRLHHSRTIAIVAFCLLATIGFAAIACSSESGKNASSPDNLSSGGPNSDASSSGDVPGGAESAAPGAIVPGEGDAQTSADPALQGLLDRKIVESTSVDMGVDEVGRSFQEVIRFATTAGGFVASSTFSNVDDDQIADITVRVPSSRYQDVLGQIRGLGDVKTESSDASDVTEEYTALGARLRALQATEQRYLDLLAQAGTIDDILTVQDRLDGVRLQIEQVQGRINLLDNMTDLATITAHLRPLAASAGGSGGGLDPLGAAENAWEASFDALRGLALVALVVAAFSWWLLLPLAVLGFGARWWLGRRPRTANESPV